MKIQALTLTALCLMTIGCSDRTQPQDSAASLEPAAEASTPPTADAAPTTPAPAPSAIDESGPVMLDANVDMPTGFDTAIIEIGECMTPVDYFNDKPVVPRPYPADGDVVASGWNITSSKDDPVPAAIFGLFKPYDKSMKGTLLSGDRTERADVAGENKQFTMSGFRLVGKFPSAAGKYRFYILTGTKDRLIECDSKVVVQVQ
ncbi:MAG: hypothetical protein IT473_12945 [Lysobacter sp.]|nr:hypothetical protein [Lysobacter sp.]